MLIDNLKSFNVCFIKIRSKHNSNTLLSLLRIFMKQALYEIVFESPIIALCDELAKLGKASQDTYNPGVWVIL